jgi:hypothetical protein
MDMLSGEHAAEWRPAETCQDSFTFQIRDGVVWGQGGVIGCDAVFDDFVLDGEFLFDGTAEGGVQIRGYCDAERTWEVGYEMDIDWAPDGVHGHIHYPVKPKPYAGEALFEVGKWQSFRVKAAGPLVTTYLNGEKVLQFEDEEYREGQICLQVEVDGVKYRNLHITPL